jgi:(DL)-glycerol-3-phosphatase
LFVKITNKIVANGTIIRSVVMVPDAALDLSYQKQADQVISSLLEFQPQYWGLPPFDD